MVLLSRLVMLSLAVLLGGAATLSFAAPAAKEPAQGNKFWVYVGTYTQRKSKGIYRCEFDSATGKLSKATLAAETVNPTFLAIHPSNHYLYAVGEIGNFGGKKSGAVHAFTLDPKTGALKHLNAKPSSGQGPCHVVVDRQGKSVLVANYGGGNASVLHVQDDGQLGERTAFVQHAKAAHAHSINLDAANRFAVVADLGLDKVFVYRFDADKGSLAPNDPPFVALAPKAGPRHFAFHPNGQYAYVINELGSTMTAMKYDAEQGVLKKIQTLSTLPEGYKERNPKDPNSTAEVQVHPSGKFVYGSNRGHDSIAIFTVDPKTGTLTVAGHQGKGIKTPRNFGIDPTGQWLLVANQDSDSIIVFRIDVKTGALEPTEEKVEVGNPVCVKFLAQTP